MVAFSDRPLCYQVGILLLLLATSMFAIGLALPWWAQTYSDVNDVVRHSGLWVGCSSDSTENCSAIDAPGWFKAVQGLQVVALVGMVVGCAYAVFTNCCLDQLTYSRTVELSSGAGGLLGLVSAMLYVAKTSHILRKNRHISYSWAFGIDVASCVLITFVAAIIALSNSRLVADSDDTRFIIEEAGAAGTGSRHRSRSRGGAVVAGRRGMEMEMERSPARTRRLGGTSGSQSRGAEVIVLQNNYVSADLQRPRPDGNSSRSSSASAAAATAAAPGLSGPTCLCACRSLQRQNAAVSLTSTSTSASASTSSSGRCEEGSLSCHGHAARCCWCGGAAGHGDCRARHSAEYSSDCHCAPCTRAQGPCTKLPTQKALSHALPGNRHSSYEPYEKSGNGRCSVVLPLTACSSCCSSAALRGSAPPHCEIPGQDDCGKFIDEKSVLKADSLDKSGCPDRAIATAPPLEAAEYGDHVDFATAQYFVNSETIFVGDAPKRGQ